MAEKDNSSNKRSIDKVEEDQAEVTTGPESAGGSSSATGETGGSVDNTLSTELLEGEPTTSSASAKKQRVGPDQPAPASDASPSSFTLSLIHGGQFAPPIPTSGPESAGGSSSATGETGGSVDNTLSTELLEGEPTTSSVSANKQRVGPDQPAPASDASPSSFTISLIHGGQFAPPIPTPRFGSNPILGRMLASKIDNSEDVGLAVHLLVKRNEQAEAEEKAKKEEEDRAKKEEEDRAKKEDEQDK